MSLSNALGMSLFNLGLRRAVELGFRRVQVGTEIPDDEIASWGEKLREYGVQIVFHFPVLKGDLAGPRRVPVFVDDSWEGRRRLRELFRRNMEIARKWGVDCVVTHFVGSGDGLDSISAREIAIEEAGFLDEMVCEYKTPIFLEFGGYDPSFSTSGAFVKLVVRYPRLKLCLDTGHLYLSSIINGRDHLEDAETLAPYVGLLHLWNSRGIEHRRRFQHVPVHPDQNLADGWADVPRILRFVWRYNPQCPIVFEPDFIYGDEKYMMEGVRWIESMINEFHRK